MRAGPSVWRGGASLGWLDRAAQEAPARAVVPGPVDQGSLEADVAAGLLGLDPLMAEDFFALGEELRIQGRTGRQVGFLGVELATCGKSTFGWRLRQRLT